MLKKLLVSEQLSKNEHIGDHKELLFNHGFIMFPLDKLAKLSPSLPKDLKKFFDQFSQTENFFAIQKAQPVLILNYG